MSSAQFSPHHIHAWTRILSPINEYTFFRQHLLNRRFSTIEFFHSFFVPQFICKSCVRVCVCVSAAVTICRHSFLSVGSLKRKKQTNNNNEICRSSHHRQHLSMLLARSALALRQSMADEIQMICACGHGICRHTPSDQIIGNGKHTKTCWWQNDIRDSKRNKKKIRKNDFQRTITDRNAYSHSSSEAKHFARNKKGVYAVADDLRDRIAALSTSLQSTVAITSGSVANRCLCSSIHSTIHLTAPHSASFHGFPQPCGPRTTVSHNTQQHWKMPLTRNHGATGGLLVCRCGDARSVSE